MSYVLTDSILITIKKMLGFEADYEHYDMDLIILINACIRELYQLGIGEKEFAVNGMEQTWTEYLGEAIGLYDDAKSYIYYKVRLAFDPPSNSFVTNSIQELLKETAWRLTVAADEKRIDDINE